MTVSVDDFIRLAGAGIAEVVTFGGTENTRHLVTSGLFIDRHELQSDKVGCLMIKTGASPFPAVNNEHCGKVVDCVPSAHVLILF